jgi:hypothetical protein
MNEEQPQVSVPEFCGVATYPAGATYGPRPLRDWEFVWIIEGNVEYSIEAAQGAQHVAAPPVRCCFVVPASPTFFVGIRKTARVTLISILRSMPGLLHGHLLTPGL